MTGSRPVPERGTAGTFAILSAGEIVARLLSFVAILLLTRALGVETFGIVALALAAVTYAELAVDFGLSHLGQLEVARARTPVPELITAVVTSRIGIAVLAGAGLLSFAKWSSLPPGAAEAIALFGLVLVPRAVELDWALLGSRSARPVAWATVAGEAVLAVGVLVTVHGPEDLLRVPLVYLAARGIRAGITGVSSIGRFGAPRHLPDPGLASELLRQAAPMAASLGCGLMFLPFDLVYVGIVRGAEASGLFGASHRLYLLLFLVSLAYFRALRPDFGRGSIDGFDSIDTLVTVSLRVTAAGTIGIAVGGAILADPLLALFFGEPYAEAAGVLRALLVGFVLGTAAWHHRDLLVAFGHQRVDLGAVATAAGLNVVLDIAVVPVWGIVGAATATALSTCVLLGLVVAASRRRIGRVAVGLPSLRILASAAALGGFLLLVDAPHVLVRVLLGGALYVGLLLVTRAVRLEDVRRLNRVTPRTDGASERSDLDRGRERGRGRSTRRPR